MAWILKRGNGRIELCVRSLCGDPKPVNIQTENGDVIAVRIVRHCGDYRVVIEQPKQPQ